MLQSTRMGGNIKKGKTRNTLFSLNLKTPKRLLFNAPIFELTGCKKWQERKHGNLPAFTKNQTTRNLNLKTYDILTTKSLDAFKRSGAFDC